MDLLAAAASSDEGGITGFLLDLVETLGPVGVGLAILLETIVPPIPSEAVLGLAGVLINDGRMSVVPVVLLATLGSVIGAIFFYYVGRALGPRRSHAFLDRRDTRIDPLRVPQPYAAAGHQHSGIPLPSRPSEVEVKNEAGG